MENPVELPQRTSFELDRRTDAEGHVFGTWSTGAREQSLEDELHEKSKGVSVDARTDYGGPYSRYETKNEDIFFAILEDGSFFVGVLDGAGGSKKGREAARLAAEALTRLQKEYPEKSLKSFMNVTDEFVGANAEGGFATGVVLRGKKQGTHWQIEIGATGDCKVLTIRKGKKVPEATTTLQNQAALFTKLSNEPEKYYTHPGQIGLYGGFGLSVKQHLVEKPEILTFKGESGDQYVAASDGFWDLVSEYEVEELSKQHQGHALQEKLYELAYLRNNSTGIFLIQHNVTTTVQKQLLSPLPDGSFQKHGDNITVAVVELLPEK